MEEKYKFKNCRRYFDELAMHLKPLGYVVIPSCNGDLSAYLVPAGTEDQVTYHSKPEFSFRVSDHWNWYANIKKCSDPNYVQCFCFDVVAPRRRDPIRPEMATKPRDACLVAFYGKDHTYHCIYGDAWEWPEKKYVWRKEPIMKIVDMIKNFQQWDMIKGGQLNE